MQSISLFIQCTLCKSFNHQIAHAWEVTAQTSIGPNIDGPNWTSILEGLSLNFFLFLSRRRGFRLLLAALSRAVPLSFQLQHEPRRGGGGERGVSSPSMATTTAPEDAPSAAKGAKGEAKRKQSNWRGGGGGGGGRGDGGQGQKRKRKEVFVYGNYRNYYGYRVSEHPPLPLSLILRARRSLLCVWAHQLFDGMPRWWSRCSWDWDGSWVWIGTLNGYQSKLSLRMYLSYSGVISDLICCGLQ